MASSTSAFATAPLFNLKKATRRFDTARLPPQISAAYTSVDRSSASLYEILGIQTSATCQEIKQAYRKLARVSHPDVAASGADEFMRIHSAYATLSDPEKRADYDRTIVVGKRRTVTAPYGYARAAADTAAFSCRRWETDQCW